MKSGRAYTVFFRTIRWVLYKPHPTNTNSVVDDIGSSLEQAPCHPWLSHGPTGAAIARFDATTPGSRGSVNPNLSHALVVPSDQCVLTNGRPELDAALHFAHLRRHLLVTVRGVGLVSWAGRSGIVYLAIRPRSSYKQEASDYDAFPPHSTLHSSGVESIHS